MKTLLTRPRSTSIATPATASGAAEMIAEAILAADAAVPEYHQIIERLERDLRPREAGLERRRSDLVVGLSRQAVAEDLAVRARRLIEDDVIPRADRDRDLVLKTIETIVDELRVVRAAIAMQTAARDQAHLRWSEAVCRALAPLHKRQVQAIAAAVAALSAALVAHGDSMDALSAADVAFTGTVRPMLPFGDAPRLDREWSTASMWMADVRAAGLLEG